MSIAKILQTLSSRQIRLKLDGDSLQFNAPKGALTPDLQRLLKDNKPELIHWLKTNRKIASESESPLEQIQHDAKNQYEPFPLSDLQVAFYMANDPFMEFQVRPHYYMENTYDNLDSDRYERAWNKALARHQKELVLLNKQKQLALIQPTPELKIPVLDLSDTPEAEVASALNKVREDMMRSELPLNRWPWFDLRISRWTDNGVARSRVHYNNNNFYSDGLGTTGLLKEVWEYYEHPNKSREPIEIGFRDAVMALERLERSEKGRAAQDYWLKKIADLPPAPAIPLAPGKERRVRARMNRREFFVNPETWKSFKSNAEEHGLTSSNAVLTLQAKVLSVYSGQEHFILSHMATRRLPVHRQIKEMLGNFASLYPLEVDFRGDHTFSDSAQRLQRQVMKDSAQLYWGGMKVMRELNKQSGEMGASPCPYVVGSGIFMGAYDKPEFSCLETSQTLLDHQFWELTDGRFYGVWDLLEEFYPPGLIDSMWESYQALFLQLAKDKTTWNLPSLRLTPASDLSARQRLNASEQVLPGGLLHTPLSDLPKDWLARPAAITKGAPLSYRELDEQSNSLAHALIDSEVTAGARVALVMERGNALIVALAAVLKAGGAYVPVNPELPPQRRQYLIENCGAKHIITETKWRESLASFEETKVLIDAKAQSSPSRARPEALVNERDLAYIIYTSGSTGTPKGVAISHEGAVNTIQDINRKFDVSARDRIMAVSAYSFDLSVYDVFGAWAAGATVLYPDPEAAYNPSHWFDLMQEEGATIWNSAPPLMALLAETGIRQGRTLPALRLVMLSGDWIPLGLPDQIKKIAPNAKIISLGGATEASIWSIYYPIDRVSPEWLSIPYGMPLANQTWHILDRHGNPVPTYTPGELYIGGKGLALEYWNDQEKSARSFIHHPVSKERLYRTGDQGRYLLDGTIEFLGRLDGQVKIQGHRIELGEIEVALRNSGLVTESVVLAQAGRDHHDKRLVAHVIPQAPVDDESAFAQTLQTRLQKVLPSYMVPKTWNIVEQFPITQNGKIDRKALSEILPLETKPAESMAACRTRPAPGTERTIYDIWAEVLGHKDFGATEDFFDMGGQSFDAVRIAGLLGEKFKMPLSLGDMWRERTVQNIARYLDEGSGASDQSHLVALNHNAGPDSPLFMVHPAGGYCVRYRELSQRLNRPAFGLQASGLDGRSEALDDIPEIARRYVKDIRSQQPNGPYQIGGWSSGGLIAFEIVRQLREQGQKVEPLWIIDCPSPHEHDSIPSNQMVLWFLEDMALELPVGQLAARMDQSESERDLFEHAIALLNTEVQANLDTGLLWPIYNVFSHIVAAGRRYAPPPIDVDIVLCRARDGQVSEFASHPHNDEAHWGWALLTKGNVHVEFCPGTHHSVLDHEHVDAVASVFSRTEVECEPV